MPSFNKISGAFPVGYFRKITQWLLRERRDIAARVVTLEAEMARIGKVTVVYEQYEDGEHKRASYNKLGFKVTKGSSLQKLVQAYIALGGNPFDISGFLYPDTTEYVEGAEEGTGHFVEVYPKGGSPYPKSAEYNEPLPEVGPGGSMASTGYESYQGGMVDHPSYMPLRMGERADRGSWDYATVSRVMHGIRTWANKEIKTKLQDKEWQILKLADCCEQLRKERDEVLMGAFGGQLEGLPPLDEEMYDPRRLVQILIQDMYNLMYEKDGDGVVVGTSVDPEVYYAKFAVADIPGDGIG